MRALSIRQPYAELILRGVKTAELRSRATRIVGERFYIYASKKKGQVIGGKGQVRDGGKEGETNAVWSMDLEVARVPGWMVELAEQVRMIEPGALLPTGVIVGSAVIERVVPPDPADGTRGVFRWELADVRRFARTRKPDGHPQPAWFRPFDRE